jgi:SAM-dependent methyltransferase
MGPGVTQRKQAVTLRATTRGVRVVQEGHVVSEVVARPGPTHSLFDVLAAAVVTLARGPRLALLGLGGGSVVAPLRALGWAGSIAAVDRSREMVRVFRRIAAPALGPVSATVADAAAWLGRQQEEIDVVVEDLSVPVPGDLVMPEVCFDPLPHLIGRHLAPGGVAVVNAFSPGPQGWDRLLQRLRVPGTESLVVHLDEFDHRVLLLGEELPAAPQVGRRLRQLLHQLRSRQATRVRVRHLP